MSLVNRIKGAFGSTNAPTQQTSNLNDVGSRLLSGKQNQRPRKSASGVLQSFGMSPTIYAIADRVAQDVAANPVTLFQGGEAVEQHELLDALRFPVASLPPDAQIYLVALWLDLVGEGGLIKRRDERGRVVSLWPLPPTWVTDLPRNEGEPFVLKPAQGTEFRAPASEVIWFSRPNPADPYARGVGTGQALADELEIAELSSKTIKQWFYNGGKPDVLVIGEGMGKEQSERLEEKWDQRHGGFWNKYKPAFMGGKNVTVHTLSQSFKDMELVQLRQDERRMIQQTWGIPPEIMGDVQDSNRATIDAADLLYGKRVLKPRLSLIYKVLNLNLVQEFGEDLELVFETPVQEDKDFQLKVMTASPWAFPVDEWRTLAGKEALDNNEGQVYMLPPNILPSRTPMGEPVAPASDPGQQEASASVSHQRKGLTDLWPRIDRALQQEPLKEAITPRIAETVEHFGREMYDRVKSAGPGASKDFDLEDPRVVEFLREVSGGRVRRIEDTTRRHLRNVLQQAETDDLGIEELARQIETVMTNDTRRRSVTIARTETVRAANFGNFNAGKQAGVKRKEWLDSADDRVRDEHEYLGMRPPVDYDAPFVGPNGEEGNYPGDFGVAEMDIQCRCTMLPVQGERSMFDTRTKRDKRWKEHDNQRMRYEVSLRQAVRARMLRQMNAVLEAIQ